MSWTSTPWINAAVEKWSFARRVKLKTLHNTLRCCNFLNDFYHSHFILAEWTIRTLAGWLELLFIRLIIVFISFECVTTQRRGLCRLNGKQMATLSYDRTTHRVLAPGLIHGSKPHVDDSNLRLPLGQSSRWAHELQPKGRQKGENDWRLLCLSVIH